MTVFTTARAKRPLFMIAVTAIIMAGLLWPLINKTATAANDSSTKAQDFIRSMGDDAVDFLGDDSLSTNEKQRQFSALLNEKFDMETIGRFSLGARWRQLDEEQRREYQKLFREMIVQIYSRRFSDYQGQDFEVDGARILGEDDVLVRSYIVPDQGNRILVEWRVRNRDGRMRVIDVVIEQVSMAMTQRSDFNSIIQRGGGSAALIIDHLQERTQSSDSSNRTSR